ncbi:MAG TPA: LON peptidase substrate-binding domain-containing protein [Dongiaceae bacterium]|jgi:hypothetical protein|nr:LON peptidase substrate-binding domain-containing protein [Dongiaceae bacterium]
MENWVGDPKKSSDLPEWVPCFPLSDALLLPGSRLPLVIFEERYLRMLAAALAGSRLIGMTRPVVADAEKDLAPINIPRIHRIGCLGRIVAFEELPDGRVRIDLRGLVRFRVVQERFGDGGFRLGQLAYNEFFEKDMASLQFSLPDRRGFVDKLRLYLKVKGLQTDWENVDKIPDEVLLLSTAQTLPFSALEKQGLLECETKRDLFDMMIALFELGVQKDKGDVRMN